MLIELFFISVIFSSTTSNNSLSRAPQSTSAVSDINSPLIQEDGDNKVLKLRFDVSQYTPEEIVVKTVDNKLMVSVSLNFSWKKFNDVWIFIFFRSMPNTKKKQIQRAFTENTIVNSCCLKMLIPNLFAHHSVRTVF